MTTDDIKFGHVITGECYHEQISGSTGPLKWKACSCGLRGHAENPNRTFTDPRDTFALEQALVRDGRWDEAFRKIGYVTYFHLGSEGRSQKLIDAYRENPEWLKNRKGE